MGQLSRGTHCEGRGRERGDQRTASFLSCLGPQLMVLPTFVVGLPISTKPNLESCSHTGIPKAWPPR